MLMNDIRTSASAEAYRTTIGYGGKPTARIDLTLALIDKTRNLEPPTGPAIDDLARTATAKTDIATELDKIAGARSQQAEYQQARSELLDHLGRRLVGEIAHDAPGLLIDLGQAWVDLATRFRAEIQKLPDRIDDAELVRQGPDAVAAYAAALDLAGHLTTLDKAADNLRDLTEPSLAPMSARICRIVDPTNGDQLQALDSAIRSRTSQLDPWLPVFRIAEPTWRTTSEALAAVQALTTGRKPEPTTREPNWDDALVVAR